MVDAARNASVRQRRALSTTAGIMSKLVQEDSAFKARPERIEWAGEWLYGISYLNRRNIVNRRAVRWLRGPVVFGALLVPILATGAANSPREPFWRWATVGVSIVVALCTAIDQVVRPAERWRQVRQTQAALEAEGWTFLERAGRYAEPDDTARFHMLFEAVERLWSEYERMYLSHIAQVQEISSMEGKPPQTNSR